MAEGRDIDTGADAAASAPDSFARTDPPILELTIWPHRSLTPRGFQWTVVLVALGLGLPLVGLIGTMAAWGLLPFLIVALIGFYAAIQRSYADGRLTEQLRLWPDLITVERREPRGRVLRWDANPFWVQPRLNENAKIEKYLTLKGNGREIELGTFLSPGERESLYADISAALGRIRSPDPV